MAARSVLPLVLTTLLALAGMAALGPPTDAAPVRSSPRFAPQATGVPEAIVDAIGGPALAVAAVTTDTAVVGLGAELVPVDVADPDAPRALSAGWRMTGVVRDVAAVGDVAFVAHDGGFQTVDLTERRYLRFGGAQHLMDGAVAVAVAGGHAYVLGGQLDPEGLTVFDVADPARPRRVDPLPGQMFEWTGGRDVAVADGRLYVVMSDRVRVADLAEPGVPRRAGTIEGLTRPTAVAAVGTRLVVVGAFGLAVYDVADPDLPAHLGTLALDGAPSAVVLDGARAVVSTTDGPLHVVDLSDPAAPRLEATVGLEGEGTAVAVAGELALVAAGGTGLRVASLPAGAPTSRRGVLATIANARDAAATAGWVFVAGGASGLVVVEHPGRSPQAGDLRIAGAVELGGSARKVALHGARAYVLVDGPVPDGGPDEMTWLAVVDLADPAAPRLEGVVVLDGRPEDLAADERYAYTVGDEAGLQIADAADPAAPVVVGRLADSERLPNGIALRGDVAYVADATGGARAIDVTDRTAPAVLGAVDFRQPHVSRGIALRGDRLWVAASPAEAYWPAPAGSAGILCPPPPPPDNETLLGIEVTDPRAMRVVERRPVDGWPRDLAVAEDRIYVASSFARYYSKALLIHGGFAEGRLELPDVAHGVTASGLRAYVADGTAGLIAAHPAFFTGVLGTPSPTPTATSTDTTPEPSATPTGGVTATPTSSASASVEPPAYGRAYLPALHRVGGG